MRLMTTGRNHLPPNSRACRFAAAGFVACQLMLSSFGANGADYTATLDWARRIELSTPVSGVVGEVKVRPGQQVDEGELLVRLDQRGFDARVALALAAEEEARQNRNEAHRELERARELYERTVLSDHELQLARIGAARADAVYNMAKAFVTETRLALEYSAVRAPFSGIILSVSVLPGSTVVNRFRAYPILTLADNRVMTARAEVAEDRLASLRSGEAVQIVIAADRIPGRIVSIGQEAIGQEEQGAVYQLEAEFTVPERRTFRVGQKAVVRIDE